MRYLLALISIALRASVVPYLGLDQSHLRTNSTVLTIPYWEPTKDILSNKYGTHIVAFEYFSFFSFGDWYTITTVVAVLQVLSVVASKYF